MSAHFAQARDCQLFQDDIENILLFPHVSCHTIQAAFEELNNIHCNNNNNNDNTVDAVTTAKLGAIYTLTQTILSSPQLRDMVSNSLVKISIPRLRREQLIDHNLFIQRLIEAEKEKTLRQQEEQEQQEQQIFKKVENTKSENSNSYSGSNNARSKTQEHNSNKKITIQHRVGRVIALLPKPGAEETKQSSIINEQNNNNDNNNNDSDNVSRLLHSIYTTFANRHNNTTLYSKWLVAIHFGECVEVMSIKHIVNELFSEEEFTIYVQSSLSTALNASLQNKLSSSGPNVLLSSEQAEAFKLKLQALRSAFTLLRQVVKLKDNDGLPEIDKEHVNTIAVTTLTQENKELKNRLSLEEEYHQTSNKRPRSEQDEREEEQLESSNHNDNHNITYIKEMFNHKIAHMELREREMMEQLHKLRELVSTRDSELAHSLQTQRQVENAHRSKLSQWKAKLEDEAQSRQRVQRKLQNDLENMTALEKEGKVKLRRLAELAMNYKRIVDEVKRQLSQAVNNKEQLEVNTATSNNNNNSARLVDLDKPETILAQLRQATLIIKELQTVK